MEIMYFDGNSNESKVYLNNNVGNVHSVTIIACQSPLVIVAEHFCYICFLGLLPSVTDGL